MNTLNSAQILHLLDIIDSAKENMEKVRGAEYQGTRDLHAAMGALDLKLARDKLLRASLSNVAVEPIPTHWTPLPPPPGGV